MRACDNPFRMERAEALRYRSPDFSWPKVLARLERNRGRGALRGAQGSGKTTLLGELAERLAEMGFEVRRLRPNIDDRGVARNQVRALPTDAGPSTALLLDGADRLGILEWHRFVWVARPAAVLVITTHRQGRLPTLHPCSTSVELLAQLSNELVPAAELATVHFGKLFFEQRGNVRLALRALYDQFAVR